MGLEPIRSDQNGWWVECLVDIGSLRWDCPTVKLIADSRGRLAARGIFQPGKAFDATPQPDGSIRLMEIVEREVPVVKLKKNRAGLFLTSQPLSRAEARATIRSDREAQ